MKKLRHLLLATALGLAATHASANPALVGFWTSSNAKGGALAGTLDLAADGAVTLAPQGQPVLQGKWTATAKELSFEVDPYGTSKMRYRLAKKGLTLIYENGVEQSFTKSTRAKK